VIIRNANKEEVKVKPRDTGGKRRRGGSGWEESSHLKWSASLRVDEG
jgi:hypothetical protein